MPEKRHTLLIVDDEQDYLFTLRLAFEEEYEVLTASTGTEALEIMEPENVAVVIADQRMPEMNGATFLSHVKESSPQTIRMMLTGYTDMDALVLAVNSGQIFRYIAKPCEIEELKMEVRRAINTYEMSVELERRYEEITRLNSELEEARQKLEQENVQLRQAVQTRYQFDGLIGSGPAMERVYGLVEKVLKSNVSVLITGETGTGKELMARCIHFNGHRSDGPFVAQNCGAMSPELLESELFGHKKGSFTGASEDRPGLFETADGGTVFLDEIGEMSPAMQVRMLRVLQEGEIRRVGETIDRPVDVRVVAATNRDLQAEVTAGRFREDLFFRLHVFPIGMPPLRDRIEDIPPLADHFLSIYCDNRPVRFTPEAMDLLSRHSWPGNVRELENEVQRALLLAGEVPRIGPEALSAHIRSDFPTEEPAATGSLKKVVAEVERELIAGALRRTQGNRTHAARALGISRWGLVQKIDRYDIDL